MDNVTLNGFEVFEELMPGASVKNKPIVSPTNEEEEETKIDLEGVGEELSEEELNNIRKNTKTETEEEPEPEEQTKRVKKNSKSNNIQEEETKDDTDDNTDDGEDDILDNTISGDNSEASIVGGFFDSISEKLGWEDVEEDEKPQTVEDLIDYFAGVIEENSVPQYASEEVEQLDKFVKNGGNLRDYFSIDNEIDLDDIDLEDESNQKLVLKEFLKEKGFNAKQIEKKLTKYEEAGILEDESQDAAEALKDIRENKKQQLLKDQENAAKLAAQRQQEYFDTVVNEIKGMDNIRGVKIPEKDKQILLEYIFKPTSDGMTKFQKDWSKSVKNLIESAYFTMKGDTLVKAAEVKGQNAAINKFKNSLNRTGVSRKTNKQDNTSTESMWNSFARRLRAN